jgi:hypothetical protein
MTYFFNVAPYNVSRIRSQECYNLRPKQQIAKKIKVLNIMGGAKYDEAFEIKRGHFYSVNPKDVEFNDKQCLWSFGIYNNPYPEHFCSTPLCYKSRIELSITTLNELHRLDYDYNSVDENISLQEIVLKDAKQFNLMINSYMYDLRCKLCQIVWIRIIYTTFNKPSSIFYLPFVIIE